MSPVHLFAFSDPAASKITLAAVLLLFALDTVLVRRRATREQDQGTFRLILIVQLVAVLLGVAAAIYLPSATIPGSPWIPVGLGSALVLTGALFRGWAVIALGSYFTRTVTVTEGQQVVTSGPYALVRHPSYTGALIAFAGFGLILANWLSLAVLLGLPVAVYARRISVEEMVLKQQLGEPYTAYARDRARLLPGVW